MNDEILSSGSTGIVPVEETELADVDVDLSVEDYNPEHELPAQRDSEYLERTDDQSDLTPRSTYKSSSLQPLSYWDQATKQTFNRMPQQAKKVWLSSAHKDAVRYERALAQLNADYAPLAEVGEVLAPIANAVTPKYGTVANYVKALIIEDSIVGTDPAVHVARIMRDMNLSPNDITYALQRLPQIEQQLRTVLPLQARAEKAEKILNEQARAQDMEDQRALDNFFSQTDKRGRPLYPDIANLKEYIYDLIVTMEKDAQARGQSLQPEDIDLDALYKKARALRNVLKSPLGQPGLGLNKNAMGDEPVEFNQQRTSVSGQRFVGPFDASKIDLDDDRVYRQMAAEAEGYDDPSETSYGDMGSDE